jgi:hypothetical protein
MAEGIATISFYKGAKSNFKAECESLRAQFHLVVAANPWLAGRLVKAPKKCVRLRHSVSPSVREIDSLFITTKDSTVGGEKDTTTAAFKISPSSSYTKICTEMYKAKKKLIVGSGSAILGKDEPVALLTMAESEIAGEFALIFSICHAIGDGRTYYEIFKMLQPGAEVRELNSNRVMSFSETMREACGRKELEWSDSASVACMYTCAMLCAKKVKCVAFHLDPDRLAAAKLAGAALDSEVPFVTTNDILTSAFFTECGARIGMMGMDCRERLEGISIDLAGNYVTALTMDDETFSTPATIHKMLSSSMPYETTKKSLPTCCTWLSGRDSAKFAMVTNWSSFAGGMVQLSADSELVIHLPVQNPAYCVYDLMIPFASGVGKVGVICWTVSTDEEGLRRAMPVGECVSRGLFP